jgi:hypothetical protein
VERDLSEILPADLEMDHTASGHCTVESVGVSPIEPIGISSLLKANIGPPVAPSSYHASSDALTNRGSVGIERSRRDNVPLWRVLVEMIKSPRGASGFAMTFVFGLTLGMQDSTSDEAHFRQRSRLMSQAHASCSNRLA